ncbi:MAG: Lrp/AsnC family transcriptional regulator [Anaerolineae bacterium]
MSLDQINQKILGLLRENARLSFAEIGKVVHLSAPAVSERVRKMEIEGVITGYQVQVDQAALGFPISVFVLMKVFHGREPMFMDFVKQQLEVIRCVNVTGEKAFLVEMALASIAELDEVLERFAALGETSTMIVLSTVVKSQLRS